MMVQVLLTNVVNLCEIFGLDLYINKNLGFFVWEKNYSKFASLWETIELDIQRMKNRAVLVSPGWGGSQLTIS